MQKYWVAIAAAAMLGAVPALAAGPTSGTNELLRQQGDMSTIEKAASRCWWSNGVRRCTTRRGARVYGYRSYGRSGGVPQPEELRTGSTEWWRSMDFYDRGGFGSR